MNDILPLRSALTSKCLHSGDSVVYDQLRMLRCSCAGFMDTFSFRVPPQMAALLSKYESRVPSICIFDILVSCDYLPHREGGALSCSPPTVGKYDTSQRNDSMLI